MAFVIRNATKADLPSCTKIFLQEFNRLGGHWTKKTAKARIFDAFERVPEFCFCLELDGKQIGFFWCDPFLSSEGKNLYLMGFAIISRHRGKGFGLETLRFIERLAKQKGFKAIMLDTNQKKKAIKIYEKFGFKKTGNILMQKAVKNHKSST